MNNNKVTIVGIKGNKGSGKSTIASMIAYIVVRGITKATYNEWYKINKMSINDSHIINFADKLKDDVSMLFNIDRNKLDNQDFKENYYYNFINDFVTITPNTNYIINSVNDLKSVTLADIIEKYNNNVAIKIRTLLQYYGTEVIRNTLWKEAFIKYTINKAFNIRCFNDFCIIADVRFDNEEKAILKCGGKIIYTYRNTKKDTHPSEDIHNSETDYVVDNNGSLMALYYNVLSFVKQYMI